MTFSVKLKSDQQGNLRTHANNHHKRNTNESTTEIVIQGIATAFVNVDVGQAEAVEEYLADQGGNGEVEEIVSEVEEI